MPERGFSINKYLLDVHGNSIKNETIVALRMVKDYVISVGGIMKVSISKQLLSSVKSARQRYNSDLAANREQKMKLERKRLQEAETTSRKIELLNEQIKYKESGVVIANDCVIEENEKLQIELSDPKITKEKLQKVQSLISMGLERKWKLESEIKDLEVEKTKLLKK